MNTDLASLHAIVQGRVHGVFFRAFVHRHAMALGLTGYVRNLPLSSVEVRAEGERDKLEELLKTLYQGPPGARVDRVEVSWGDHSGDFPGFSIRH